MLGGASMAASMTERTELPRRTKAIILALVVAQFMVGAGPVWRREFDWDASILWSYATIPALVAVALLLHRRLRLRAWAVGTVEIAAAKFAITAVFLTAWLVAWDVRDGQRPRPGPPERPTAPAARPARTETRPRAPRTSSVMGQVMGGAGALVFVSAGPESFSFDLPPPATLAHDGHGFLPRALAVQPGQALRLRSSNGRLHTLLARKHGGTWVRNLPVPGGGGVNEVAFEEPVGLTSVECQVHGAAEGSGLLAILDHPLWAVADAEGRFAIQGVPPGAGELTAVALEGGRTWHAAYQAEAGRPAEVVLR
jgi:hypothetical protein